MFFMIILAVVTCYIFYEFVSKKPKKFPPGPPFMPVIGTLYCVPSTTIHYKTAEWKNRYGDIVGHKLGPYLAIFVAEPDAIISAFRHPAFQGRLQTTTFEQRTFYKKLGIFFNEGDEVMEFRRFILRYIGQFYVSKLESLMAEEMEDVFATTRVDQVTCIDNAYAPASVNIILQILVNGKSGISAEQFQKMRRVINISFENGTTLGPEVFFPSLRYFYNNRVQMEAVTYFQKFLAERLEEHKKTLNENDPRDMMDAFLIEKEKHAEKPEAEIYIDEQLLSTCFELIEASSESVSNTIRFAFMYLAMNPDKQKKMCEEIDHAVGKARTPVLKDRLNMPYTEAVITETFRVNPIAPISVPHKATEDTTFYNYDIPKDTLIILPIWELHHSTKIWQEPDKFIPERFIGDNGLYKKSQYVLPFGLGKRSCVGEVLSKNMIFLYLSSFFQRYSIRLPPGEHPNTISRPGFTYSPRPFNVIIEKREM